MSNFLLGLLYLFVIFGHFMALTIAVLYGVKWYALDRKLRRYYGARFLLFKVGEDSEEKRRLWEYRQCVYVIWGVSIVFILGALWLPGLVG